MPDPSPPDSTLNPAIPTADSGSEQCLLFADVAGSTRLYESLGDEQALNIISGILSVSANIVETHGGRVVKTIGDEIMAVFPSADQGAKATCAMMESMESQSRLAGLTLQLRAGLNLGSVIEDEGDVFGDTVNVAARLIKLARPGQIFLSENTALALNGESQGQTRCLNTIPVKGKTEEITVHELLWKRELASETCLLQPRRTGACELSLWHGNQVVVLNADTPLATIGRHAESTIVIDDSRVSRRHAKIELRRDKFILCDESTNGTFIQASNHAGVTSLWREEAILQGAGFISVGHPLTGAVADQVEQLLLRFQVS
ncbi:MAG TPA: adenylate/guanylate cyclase domain-containing protein [Methylococcaceae bacterium]|nr:adenylate/guanylate cyclase domain-containing protein [Methylococcaceae bacterium]